MSSISLAQCAKFLIENDNFLLITHRRPDGDTLGSAAALCLVLRSLGKSAYLLNNTEITPKYMDFVSDLIAPEDWSEDNLLAIDLAADTMYPKNFSGGDINLCIDHHGSNSFYAGMTFVMPEKAACGEVILELINELGCGMDERIAGLLYIAISTDTGCFLYRNTTPETHRAAAAVMEAGADSGMLNKILFRTISEARMKLECMVYAGMHRYKDGEINIAIITLDMMEKAAATENDCDDLASIAGKIEGSKCSATIREISPGVSKVSLRSGSHVNSNDVCALFGGGGHPMAAGCTMPYAPEIVCEMLANAIIEAWQ